MSYYHHSGRKPTRPYRETGGLVRWLFTHYDVYYHIPPKPYLPGYPYYPEYIRRMMSVRTISQSRAKRVAVCQIHPRAVIDSVCQCPGLLLRLRRAFFYGLAEVLGRTRDVL